MGSSLTRKILEAHLVEGRWQPGSEIGIRIDQTLTQDATGTMTYLGFEAMGLDAIHTELSVSYVDHNTVQMGFENADDHRYLQTVAARYGIVYSRAGNGICHQVHLERFGQPGKTLLGADSHTPTGGGIGMMAIGAGGIDVAAAMGGQPFYMTCPRVLYVHLVGQLQPWVTAKDIVLKMLELQQAEGGFQLDARVARRLGLKIKDLRKLAEKIEVDVEVDHFRLLCTAVIIKTLAVHFASARPVWEGAAAKSIKWLNHVVTEGSPRLETKLLMEWADDFTRRKVKIKT